jgi:hypothetical protein
MIEIAAEDYWKVLSIDEAVMYCFTLNINGKIGWRLPTRDESHTHPVMWRGSRWDMSDVEDIELRGYRYLTVPVRDIKDD